MSKGSYNDWRSGHRGKNKNAFKIVYRSVVRAALQCLILKAKFPYHQLRVPYACCWHDDFREGQTNVKHYHVGRRPQKKGK